MMELSVIQEVSKILRDVMTILQNLVRWPRFTADNRYNQLNKLGSSMVIAYFVTTIYAKKTKQQLNMAAFPKLAILKSLEKTTIANTPGSQLDWLAEVAGIDVIKETTKKNFPSIPENIWKFLETDQTSIEAELFQLSGKLASLIELEELGDFVSSNAFRDSYAEKMSQFNKFKDVFQVIENDWRIVEPIIKELTSGLRNQARWMMYCRTQNCSVLGHLFETAIVSYIMSVELGNSEKVAARHFFMGIFHDIAEAWTMDMPSPLKDSIPGLRKATEEYESKMLEEHLYSKIPVYIAEAIKRVDFEREEHRNVRPLIKGADYASASLECWKNYLAGSRDFNFRRAAIDVRNKMKNGKIQLSGIGCYVISSIADKLEE